MENVVVWGAGGHAKGVAETACRLGWRIEGYIDDVHPEREGEVFFRGRTVLGGRRVLAELRRRGVESVVLAFGDNAARLALGAKLGGAGWRTPALVDPTATVAEDVAIGAGSYIGAGAIIQPGSRLGPFCIVNTGAVVEHDTVVGPGVHVGPRACLAGHVEIGRGTWVGAGAIVRDRIRIGADAVIGMGALVLADVADAVVAYGQPARVIRENS